MKIAFLSNDFSHRKNISMVWGGGKGVKVNSAEVCSLGGKLLKERKKHKHLFQYYQCASHMNE